MVVREIYARLGIKVDKGSVAGAKTVFTELRSQLELAAQAARAVGGVIQGLLGQTVDYAKEINQLAKETGLSRDSIQDLAEAADESEVSFATLREGLLRLQKNGFGKADEKLWELVDTFETVKDPAARAQLAIAHFGKGGQALVPMLAQGREALQAMIAGGREAGTIMGDDALQGALDLHVGLKELKDNAEGMARTIAGPLIKHVLAAVKVFNEWVAVNRKLISDKVGAALHWTSRILRGVWSAARLAMGALDWLAQRFGWASIAVAAFGATLLLAGKSTVLLSLKWLAIGAIVAIVAEDVEAFLKGQPSLIGDVVAAVDRLFKKLDDKEWGEKHPIMRFFTQLLWVVTHLEQSLGIVAQGLKNTFGLNVPTTPQASKGQKWDAQNRMAMAANGFADDALPFGEKLKMALGARGSMRSFPGLENMSFFERSATAFAPDAFPELSRKIYGAAAGSFQGGAVNVTVNAQTGADPNEIASATARAVQEQLATQIRAARGALVPTPGGTQ